MINIELNVYIILPSIEKQMFINFLYIIIVIVHKVI